MLIPFFACPIHAGYPSPAQDYTESALDLNEHLVRNPAATFFMRAVESSVQAGGVQDGDILIVDRSLAPRHGCTVVALVDGELMVRKIARCGDRLRLIDAGHASQPMLSSDACEIWGVVTFAIHAMS